MLALGLTYRFTLVPAGAVVCAAAVLLLLLLIWELGIVRRRVALTTFHDNGHIGLAVIRLFRPTASKHV